MEWKGSIGKYYTTDEDKYTTYDLNPVCAFDVDDETIRHEPWTGSLTDYKENLDVFWMEESLSTRVEEQILQETMDIHIQAL